MNRLLYFVLLIALPITGIADTKVVKDWFWSSTPEYNPQDGRYMYAGTFNKKGQIFGVYCYENIYSCFYIVDLDTSCIQSSEKQYPALLNTNLGAEKIFLTCGHEIEGGNALYAADFDQMDSLVRKASHIGFALPMKDETFKVVRFSLKGSTKATIQMRERALRLFKEGGSSSRYLPDEERL